MKAAKNGKTPKSRAVPGTIGPVVGTKAPISGTVLTEKTSADVCSGGGNRQMLADLAGSNPQIVADLGARPAGAASGSGVGGLVSDSSGDSGPLEGKLGRVASMKRAAALLDCPLELLKKLKSQGVPGFDDHGRVDCDLIASHLADPEFLAQIEGMAGTSKEAVEIEKLKLQCEKIRFGLDVDRKRFRPAAEVWAKVLAVGKELQSVLRAKLELELPARLEGLPAAEIRVRMKELVDDLCRRFQNGTKDFVAEG